jgi:DeoR/GlpR family transcriptional regulator of sugar metabolism
MGRQRAKRPRPDKPSVADRIYHILERLHAHSEVRVTDLANELGVTDTTIRADINWLAEAGAVKKFHGGAKVVGIEGFYTGLFRSKTLHCAAEKDLIASFAVTHLIADGDNLLLDSGTQLEAFVHQLRHKRSGIRAISHAANLAMHFLTYPDSEYVQLGGLLNTRAVLFADGNTRLVTERFFEDMTDKFLRDFCQTGRYKAVITGTALTCDKGVAVNSEDAIKYKQRILKAASEVIILADHSKFSQVARGTVTHCGLAPDPWLGSETKPAVVVVDWKDQDRPAELDKFAKKLPPAELPEQVKREYRDIRVFRTTLYGQQKKA